MPLPGRPAGFWIRFGAALLDGLILLALEMPLLVVLFRREWSWLETTTNGQLGQTPSLLALPEIPHDIAVLSNVISLVYFLVSIAFYVGFWTWRGQTPGYMALGLRVVRVSGAKLSLGRALLRMLGYIISGAIFDIGFIMAGFDKRKQGLHDKIADTLVVHTR